MTMSSLYQPECANWLNFHLRTEPWLSGEPTVFNREPVLAVPQLNCQFGTVGSQLLATPWQQQQQPSPHNLLLFCCSDMARLAPFCVVRSSMAFSRLSNYLLTNHHPQKQCTDLATHALEQTSQIVTVYPIYHLILSLNQ